MVSTSHMKIHEITENIYNLLQNSKHSRLELKKPQAHKYVCLLNNDFIRTEFLENRNRSGSKRDFWPNFRLNQNFEFWPKLWCLTEISIFDQNCDF